MYRAHVLPKMHQYYVCSSMLGMQILTNQPLQPYSGRMSVG